ncbi:50S ribosomal protein L17, partial [Candidatus Cerribacteria bacterium 'Amazon FNV 2010 28 9']
MHHRVKTVKLGRNTAQRKSLFKNLLLSLFTYGEIQTTEAKAKAVKGRADKLIAKAQQNTVASRRVLA